jgi:hypothetical protein
MVIFDACTLILLAKSGILDVFISNFSGQVIIPKKVHEEVLIKDDTANLQIINLIKSGMINVIILNNKGMQRRLMEDFNIDLGEAEAIILALDNKGAVIATDDKNAIKACKLLKIEFITAISILIRAAEKQLFSKREALIKLEGLKTIGRYKQLIITDARQIINGG